MTASRAMVTITRLARFLAAGVVVAVIAGCAQTQGLGAPPTVDSSDPLKTWRAKLEAEGPRTAVLNRMEIAVQAFYAGDTATAAAALDDDILAIERVWADSEGAAKARSLWYAEDEKEFKGEPYERVMVYYYRGLLYMLAGDFENARAVFRGGLVQGAFPEEGNSHTDFASLQFLIGWTSACMGELERAGEAYDKLAGLRPDFKPPSAADRVLIVVETGFSPRKISDGVGHYELKFRRGKNFTENKAVLTLADAKRRDAYAMDDIFWQSSHRGGREVDKILLGKVEFRQTMEAVGSGLSTVGNTALLVAPLLGGAAGQAAAGVSLLGAAQMAIAVHTRTEADTRYWSGLPDMVHIAFLPGSFSGTITVAAEDGAGKTVAAKPVVINGGRDNACRTAVVRPRDRFIVSQ